MIRKESYILLLCVVLLQEVTAQHRLFLDQGAQLMDSSECVDLKFSEEMGGDQLNNAFLFNFVSGSPLTANEIQTQTDLLNPENQLSQHFSGTLHYSKKLEKFQLHATLNTTQQLGVHYTQDVFRLIFQGNKPFLGQSALLSNTSVYNTVFHSALLGASWNKKHWHMRYNTGIAWGQRIDELTIQEGHLFTSMQGDQLNLNLDANRLKSEESTSFGPKGLGWNNGLQAYYYNPEFGSHVSFEVQNLGFMIWNKQSSWQTVDTTLNFSGIEIHDIAQLQDTAFLSNEVQGIESTVSPSGEIKRQVRWLPLFGELVIGQRLTNTTLLYSGLRYRMYNYTSPHVFLGLKKNGKKSGAHVQVGYGGFANVTLGLGGHVVLAEKFRVGLSLNTIESLVLFKRYGNTALNLNLRYYLN